MLDHPGHRKEQASPPREMPSRVFGDLRPSIGYGRPTYPGSPKALKVSVPLEAKAREFDPSFEPSAAPLVVAFVAVVVAFLLFAGGALADTRLMAAMPQHGWTGAFSWLWIPAFISLGLGLLFAWALRSEVMRRARMKQA